MIEVFTSAIRSVTAIIFLSSDRFCQGNVAFLMQFEVIVKLFVEHDTSFSRCEHIYLPY